MSLDSTTNTEEAAEADAPPAQSDLDRIVNAVNSVVKAGA